MASVGALLPKEIERVSAMRERWRELAKQDAYAAVSFAPAIFLMTRALDAATAAIGADDVVGMIRVYEDLHGFEEG